MKLFTTAADPTKAIGLSEGCKADGMRPTPIGEGTEFRFVALHAFRNAIPTVPSLTKS